MNLSETQRQRILGRHSKGRSVVLNGRSTWSERMADVEQKSTEQVEVDALAKVKVLAPKNELLKPAKRPEPRPTMEEALKQAFKDTPLPPAAITHPKAPAVRPVAWNKESRFVVTSHVYPEASGLMEYTELEWGAAKTWLFEKPWECWIRHMGVRHAFLDAFGLHRHKGGPNDTYRAFQHFRPGDELLVFRLKGLRQLELTDTLTGQENIDRHFVAKNAVVGLVRYVER